MFYNNYTIYFKPIMDKVVVVVSLGRILNILQDTNQTPILEI